jgi:hypothetical protein
MRQNRSRCNVCLTQVAADDSGRCLTCQARDDDEWIKPGDDMTGWLLGRLSGP